jgi:hypothetical protein
MSILARGRIAAVLEMVAAEGQLLLRLDLLTSGALSRLRSGHKLGRYVPTYCPSALAGKPSLSRVKSQHHSGTATSTANSRIRIAKVCPTWRFSFSMRKLRTYTVATLNAPPLRGQLSSLLLRNSDGYISGRLGRPHLPINHSDINYRGTLYIIFYHSSTS